MSNISGLRAVADNPGFMATDPLEKYVRAVQGRLYQCGQFWGLSDAELDTVVTAFDTGISDSVCMDAICNARRAAA